MLRYLAIAALFAATVGMLPTALTAKPDAKVVDLPLLDEKFENLDGKIWTTTLTGNGSSVEIGKNQLTLKNRAYIFLQREMKATEGYELDLEWTWEDTGGKRPFADTFLVCLRTTGAIADKRTWETQDGLRIRFIAGYGLVQIDQVVKGEVTELGRAEVVIEKDAEKAAWPEGAGTNWYHINIVDSGTTITIKFQDKEVLKKAYNPKLITGNKAGLGNREMVGGFDQISFVRKFVLKKHEIVKKKD